MDIIGTSHDAENGWRRESRRLLVGSLRSQRAIIACQTFVASSRAHGTCSVCSAHSAGLLRFATVGGLRARYPALRATRFARESAAVARAGVTVSQSVHVRSAPLPTVGVPLYDPAIAFDWI